MDNFASFGSLMVIKQLGQISHSQDIGYKGMSQKYIWSACMDCGIQRWVQLYRGKPRNLRCKICNGKQRGKHHTNWKGGEVKLPDGYIKVWVSPDDFFYPMADKRGYVLQHRLIMATHLGRNLLKALPVHSYLLAFVARLYLYYVLTILFYHG